MKPLRDSDVGERLFTAKTILYPTASGVVLGLLVAIYLVETRHIGLGLAGVVVILGAAVGFAMGAVAWLVVSRASRGVVSLLTAGGNLTPSPSFSLQESLVIRGRYPEAARSYREHLAAHPGDDEARLALADLLIEHLADPGGAERLLREVVEAARSERTEWTAANALIDLQRAVGNQGRLMVELARFAERYRGTAAGTAAKRELMALKQSGA